MTGRGRGRSALAGPAPAASGPAHRPTSPKLPGEVACGRGRARRGIELRRRGALPPARARGGGFVPFGAEVATDQRSHPSPRDFGGGAGRGGPCGRSRSLPKRPNSPLSARNERGGAGGGAPRGRGGSASSAPSRRLPRPPPAVLGEVRGLASRRGRGASACRRSEITSRPPSAVPCRSLFPVPYSLSFARTLPCSLPWPYPRRTPPRGTGHTQRATPLWPGQGRTAGHTGRVRQGAGAHRDRAAAGRGVPALRLRLSQLRLFVAQAARVEAHRARGAGEA